MRDSGGAARTGRGRVGSMHHHTVHAPWSGVGSYYYGRSTYVPGYLGTWVQVLYNISVATNQKLYFEAPVPGNLNFVYSGLRLFLWRMAGKFSSITRGSYRMRVSTVRPSVIVNF
eukprot:SAG31_NODE_5_length_43735_cov_42.922266_35_plen_115_part_00